MRYLLLVALLTLAVAGGVSVAYAFPTVTQQGCPQCV